MGDLSVQHVWADPHICRRGRTNELNSSTRANWRVMSHRASLKVQRQYQAGNEGRSGKSRGASSPFAEAYSKRKHRGAELQRSGVSFPRAADGRATIWRRVPALGTGPRGDAIPPVAGS